MHTMYTTYNNKKEGNSDNESLKSSARPNLCNIGMF